MSKKFKSSIDLGMRPTENQNIFVDILPEFARANKFIGNYKVYVRNEEVPEGMLVAIRAHSAKTGFGEMKNYRSVVTDGVACFKDLRFIGRSGRGTFFDLYFCFGTEDNMVLTYKSAIKVTVDGPRPKRTSIKKRDSKYELKISTKKSMHLIQTINDNQIARSRTTSSSNSTFSASSPSHYSPSDSDRRSIDIHIKSEVSSPRSMYNEEMDLDTNRFPLCHIEQQQRHSFDVDYFLRMYHNLSCYSESQLMPMFKDNKTFSALLPIVKNIFESHNSNFQGRV